MIAFRDDAPENLALAEPGFYRRLPETIYHARVEGLVSKSVLDLVDRSPMHYLEWLRGGEGETSDALAFGKAFHCAVLEPETFERTYVVPPNFGDCRFKEAKAKRDEWRAANEGKILLDPADGKTIAGMVKSLRAHPLASRMIADGEAELTLRWTDEETGLQCKARADYYVSRHRMAVDVKTTEDARPDSFARSMAKWRYHVQNATYADGFETLGEELAHFVFLAIEKRPPYAIALYRLESEDVDRGRVAARRNMHTLADCIERGAYPGYSESIETLALPRWA